MHNHALIQNIFSGGGGGGGVGDPASDQGCQGWSNKFYHCQNPYFGKSRGGDVPLETHIVPAGVLS